MNRVFVWGSMNSDRFLEVSDFVRPGETIHATGVRRAVGGKGLNQAVAAARMGVDVVMVGSVGVDAAGDAILASLHKEAHLDLSRVQSVNDYNTSEAIIQAASSGDNAIIVVPGANDANRADQVESRLADLGSGDVLVCQLEVPVDSVAKALGWARQRGASTVLNVAPAAHVPELLVDVDLLVVNETEAMLLLGVDNADQAADDLHRRFGVDVIVTLGAAGSQVRTENLTLDLPALPIDVVDTTGAGDAFVGGVAASLASGLSVGEATRYGTALAAAACSAEGAQGYRQRRPEIDLLASQLRKD